MYSKEAASFPYIKKLTGVDRRDFSAVNACSLFSPDFPYPCYDLLYKAFMNIFLFNPYLFHHIKDLFSVCQIRTPESPHPAEIALGTGISLPGTFLSLHTFSIAIASDVVWKVTTSFITFFSSLLNHHFVVTVFLHSC